MRGKWSNGMEPRGFTWVFRDKLCVAERPGGSTNVHRKVRRDEELLWLKHQGVRRVVSILPPMATLEAYNEAGLTSAHYALRGGPQQSELLAACYDDLERSMDKNVVVLLHGDDVSDRLLGVVAGYLQWLGKVPNDHTAIALVERLFRRSLGPDGRAICASAPESPPRGE